MAVRSQGSCGLLILIMYVCSTGLQCTCTRTRMKTREVHVHVEKVELSTKDEVSLHSKRLQRKDFWIRELRTI